MHRSAVVVMARAPVPGTCKTRLCPPLSPEDAAALYGAFLEDIARELEAWAGADLWLAFAGEPRDEPELRRLFGGSWSLLRQRGASLTDRMEAVFDHLFGAGYDRVVMRNSDSPHLPPPLLDQALGALGDGAVVLGPDHGGGYYLVGLDRPPAGLFPSVMSTSSVYEQTARAAIARGLAVITLEPFVDVDLPEDLRQLRDDFAAPRFAGWATRSALVRLPHLEIS